MGTILWLLVIVHLIEESASVYCYVIFGDSEDSHRKKRRSEGNAGECAVVAGGSDDHRCDIQGAILSKCHEFLCVAIGIPILGTHERNNTCSHG